MKDTVIVAAMLGHVAYVAWQLHRWRSREGLLGPTELAIEARVSRRILWLPYGVLASTLTMATLVLLGQVPRFPGAGLGALVFTAGGCLATLWLRTMSSPTEFRVSGLVLAGNLIPWEQISGYAKAATTLEITAQRDTIGWRRILIPVSADERPRVEALLLKHAVPAK